MKLTITILVLAFSSFASAKMRVYYAHPLTIYGTNQEARDIETLNKLGLDVVNPNDPAISKEYEKSHDFNIFLNLVKSCDLVAFRAFADGSISSGVAGEIAAGKSKGLAVIELPTAIQKRTLSRDQTLEYLQNSGTARY
jgi:hypothetical protein